MTTCGYEMIQPGKKFVAWECELPVGHEPSYAHGLTSLDWDARERLRLVYADAGKSTKVAEREVTVVVPQHRIPMTEIISRTKSGGWSQSSGVGKLVALLEGLDYEIHAMESQYAVGVNEPETERWVIAGKHGSRIKASKTGASWVYQHNSRIVPLPELMKEVI